ncbi:hypothetical protein BD289DRAFT_221651 [Coniella lustricola]|uniref:Uncharacterized protein n=1 Tax=Coniella lustricola TaxID=2025994 RepID=A0A2T3AB08_9PEZI|nr:hypothetical protein BD289DRAFT_221651 [Coniella lustricola]
MWRRSAVGFSFQKWLRTSTHARHAQTLKHHATYLCPDVAPIFFYYPFFSVAMKQNTLRNVLTGWPCESQPQTLVQSGAQRTNQVYLGRANTVTRAGWGFPGTVACTLPHPEIAATRLLNQIRNVRNAAKEVQLTVLGYLYYDPWKERATSFGSAARDPRAINVDPRSPEPVNPVQEESRR